MHVSIRFFTEINADKVKLRLPVPELLVTTGFANGILERGSVFKHDFMTAILIVTGDKTLIIGVPHSEILGEINSE